MYLSFFCFLVFCLAHSSRSFHSNEQEKLVVADRDSQQIGIRAMEDACGGLFKLTSSNYSAWKSKMRDMLMCKDL